MTDGAGVGVGVGVGVLGGCRRRAGRRPGRRRGPGRGQRGQGRLAAPELDDRRRRARGCLGLRPAVRRGLPGDRVANGENVVEIRQASPGDPVAFAARRGIDDPHEDFGRGSAGSRSGLGKREIAEGVAHGDGPGGRGLPGLRIGEHEGGLERMLRNEAKRFGCGDLDPLGGRGSSRRASDDERHGVGAGSRVPVDGVALGGLLSVAEAPPPERRRSRRLVLESHGNSRRGVSRLDAERGRGRPRVAGLDSGEQQEQRRGRGRQAVHHRWPGRLRPIAVIGPAEPITRGTRGPRS